MNLSRVKSLLYESGWRKALRRLQVFRLLSFASSLKNFLYDILFWLSPPERIELRTGGMDAVFAVGSRNENMRIRSFGGEMGNLRILLEKAREGDVYCDVGASIGIYSVFMAKAVGSLGKVICFEPERVSRSCLELNFSLNAVKNAVIFGHALGSSAGEVYLEAVSQYASGVHRVVSGVPREVQPEMQSVRVDLGDAILERHGLPCPNILKVDVEGMEWEVLQGLSGCLGRKECRLVFCEVHFALLERAGRGDIPSRIREFLSEKGFHAEWVDSSHLMGERTA